MTEEEKKPSVESDSTDEGKEEKKGEKKTKVPEKFKDLVKKIEEMSVSDLSELVKILEEKFGVSGTPMISMGGVVPGMGAPAAGGAPETAEKSAFNIELKTTGDSKINVIKAVREITGKGLKEAKDLVDAAPVVVKENASKEEAEETKKKLEEAGATAELK